MVNMQISGHHPKRDISGPDSEHVDTDSCWANVYLPPPRETVNDSCFKQRVWLIMLLTQLEEIFFLCGGALCLLSKALSCTTSVSVRAARLAQLINTVKHHSQGKIDYSCAVEMQL